MTYRIYGALIASFGVVALMLATNETFARSGSAHGARFTSTHSISHPSVARLHRHHRGNHGEILWPAIGDFGYGPSSGEPAVDFAEPIPGDVRNTQANDIPWDWAHRYPPVVTPSNRPYVPSCPTQVVTVPDGQTVNITRCY